MATNPSIKFFKILVCDFSTQLRIPPSFKKKFKKVLPKKLPKDFILKVSGTGGRSWHVGLEKADDKFLYFRRGWKEFAEDNSLEFGELLVFKYTGNFEFELERFGRNCLEKEFARDAGEESGKPLSCKNGKHEQMPFKAMARDPEGVGDEGGNESPVPIQSDKEKQGQKNVQTESHMRLNSVNKRKKRKLRGESKEANLPDHKKFNPNYPFFRVIMKPTYVQTTYLNVPKDFMRTSRLSPRGKNVKLEVSDETWNVKMSNYPQYARLYTGWRKFAKDNSLQEGDVCRFELINDDDITFRVSIFRNNS